MIVEDYRLFVAVAEAGSLSAAARALDLSPAMVSKRVARLEERLGVTLAHRTTRRLALTAQGDRFVGEVRDILAAIDRVEAGLGGDRDAPAGPLRLTVPTSFGRLHIAPRLARFLAAYPRVALDVDLSDAFVDLTAGGVDLAIRIAHTHDERLVAHRLADSRRILCAAPAYLAEQGVPATLADLAAHRLLAAAGQTPWQLTGPDGAVTVAVRSHVRTNSSEMVRVLAENGAGIALRSLWDVAPSLAAGTLVRVLPDHAGSADAAILALHLAAPAPTPAAAAMLDFLKAAFADVDW